MLLTYAICLWRAGAVPSNSHSCDNSDSDGPILLWLWLCKSVHVQQVCSAKLSNSVSWLWSHVGNTYLIIRAFFWRKQYLAQTNFEGSKRYSGNVFLVYDDSVCPRYIYMIRYLWTYGETFISDLQHEIHCFLSSLMFAHCFVPLYLRSMEKWFVKHYCEGCPVFKPYTLQLGSSK